MAHYPTTQVSFSGWTALPVPTGGVIVQCQLAPIRITVSDNPDNALGLVLQPGQAVELAAGQKAHIRRAEGMGAVAVMESLA
ncbi:MAG: hypothetical protein Q4G24_07005 [Paracoccus sp. (in: a-proteobacteria)]|uniref:hypothetical protein n=1 Tax=Paracoccus sp. TaxID=267 RepID=UPI0026E0EC26|nr:hypothetical protein [Paracoccus sp. (in: a-proteobacteria)]MDO5621202.1 hypothetical protein [Paracoccus sp. (in: a-proteobacteria)]